MNRITDPNTIFSVNYSAADCDGDDHAGNFRQYSDALQFVQEWADDHAKAGEIEDGVSRRLFCVVLDDRREIYAVLSEDEISELTLRETYVPDWIPECISIERQVVL